MSEPGPDDTVSQAPESSAGRPLQSEDPSRRGLSARPAVPESRQQHRINALPPAGDVFFGQAFTMVDTVEVCFRRKDAAANLRAAAEWLSSNPGWYLRTLWYEHHGAREIAQYDGGPAGTLWLIAECGTDEEAGRTV